LPKKIPVNNSIEASKSNRKSSIENPILEKTPDFEDKEVDLDLFKTTDLKSRKGPYFQAFSL